ncbi:sugar transferase [uncultured Cetobacterium sp.]|uniref:sugar transferase n=1 Tax=uncultured Cetobacterium sp. TaxID=527638 RepID=UPI0025CF1DAC|nr:sugar transferase [uncultured Cetobacterium sp.]
MKLSVRIFDLVLAFILFVILLIPMSIVALMIKLTSKGPTIYKQLRTGYKENDFYIYKFRTMSVGSDKTGSITIGNDRRITKIGKILRKTKVDEFPQLINIFRGEMSFVGPRPDTPEYTEYYKKYNSSYFDLVPGITGKASIYLSNEEELMSKVENPKDFYVNEIIPKKVGLNSYHLNHFNIFDNLKIMIETVFKVVKNDE